MMNLYSALELGKNSVLTQQSIFQIIGHNIANVNTDGYSRQVAHLESVRPSVIGLKEGGMGVTLSNVHAIRDRFINNQIVERNQYSGMYDTLTGIMSAVETLFDEAGGMGISDTMTNFFKGWSDVANNPTDMATRNSLINKAEQLTSGLNNSYMRLIEQQQIADANVATKVDEINSIAKEIAVLNQKIAYAEGAKTPANDLIDTREKRIRELSEKVGINFYYEQSNHMVTIELGGRPLVSGDQVNLLTVQRNVQNSNYYDVYMDQYGQPAYNINNDIKNGQLGALLLARDGELVRGEGTVSVGASAGGFTTLNFSQAHGLSVGDLITINGETRSVTSIGSDDSVVIEDLDNPPAGNTTWQRREGYIPSYKKQLDKLSASIIANVNRSHQQGWTLETASAQGQDFFRMTDGAGTVTGIDGTGTVLDFSVNVDTTLNVGDIITVNGQTRLITSVNGNQVTIDAAIAGGVPATWKFTGVHGAASVIQVDSDVVADPTKIAASTTSTSGVGGAKGNNTNALNISKLMDSKTTVDTDNNGTADYGSFHEYLHGLFSEIGNATSSATYELEANEGMVKYLLNKRDSVSGVSLDEESALLLQFEKSFTAMGKFMGTISNLTDVIMRLVQ